MNIINNDIKKLRPKLAAEERFKLDGYLEAIANYDGIQNKKALLKCEKPNNVTFIPGNGDSIMEALMGLSQLAVLCGVTNVVAVAAGANQGHDGMYFPIGGHNQQLYFGNASGHIEKLSQNIAGMMSAFQTVNLPTGGTLADNTGVMLLSDVGSSTGGHHGSKASRKDAAGNSFRGNDDQTVFLLGNKKMNLQGKFINYERNQESIASVFSTVSQSFGAGLFATAEKINKNEVITALMK